MNFLAKFFSVPIGLEVRFLELGRSNSKLLVLQRMGVLSKIKAGQVLSHLLRSNFQNKAYC